jgi:hypothetical protein
MVARNLNQQRLILDECLMHNLSKIKDMPERLELNVAFECCSAAGMIPLHMALRDETFTCPACDAKHTYSWCAHKLCNAAKKPRTHCSHCKRCGDHRSKHCFECGHCYFAGVANSFSCACTKQASSNETPSTKPDRSAEPREEKSSKLPQEIQKSLTTALPKDVQEDPENCPVQ